jgi:hypothetical protein
MKPAGDRHRRHVMTIISTLSSILDNRVASEANWVKINEIAATAASEFEYRRLVASLTESPVAALKTETGAKAGTWKYRDHEWYADQLP